MASCVPKEVDGLVSPHPESGFQRALPPALACSCSNVFFTNNLDKGVGDMFLLFAHDPDLGSIVTSFHSRNQKGNHGHALQKSAKGSSRRICTQV